MSTLATSKRRLKVLHCINRLGLGGSENVAFEIMRQLRNRIEPALFTAKPPEVDDVGVAMRNEVESLAIPWYRGTRVAMKHGGMLFGGLALARAIDEWKPDIVHYHAEVSESCGAAMMLLARKAASKPALRTIHSSQYWSFSPKVGMWCDRRLHNASVTAVSQSAQSAFSALRQQSRAGSPHCEIIYNGVSTPACPPATGPREPKRIRLLFAGRFSPEKGLDLLCRALPLTTLPAGVKGEITFVGCGPEIQVPIALSKNAPANWKVRILSPRPSVIPLMQEHDILVIPSLAEGLPLMAIEAVRQGIAIVATAAPGLREVFPTDYAWLARPADAASLAAVMSQAIARPSEWEKNARAAQEFGRTKFDSQHMADAYSNKYLALARQV